MFESTGIYSWQGVIIVFALLVIGSVLFTKWGYKFFVLPLAGVIGLTIYVKHSADRAISITGGFETVVLSLIPILFFLTGIVVLIGGKQRFLEHKGNNKEKEERGSK